MAKFKNTVPTIDEPDSVGVPAVAEVQQPVVKELNGRSLGFETVTITVPLAPISDPDNEYQEVRVDTHFRQKNAVALRRIHKAIDAANVRLAGFSQMKAQFPSHAVYWLVEQVAIAIDKLESERSV